MPDDRPHVVLANELLDNLPFDLAERRDGRWLGVLVGVDAAGRPVEVLGPAIDRSDLPDAAVGARIPLQRAAAEWLSTVLALQPARIVVIDYTDATASMAARPWTDWVRTYRGHTRGRHPLDDLGDQDITCEVAIDQLAAVRPPTRVTTQAEFLAEHGIDELVSEAKRTWNERAHIGDLEAVRARSRVGEAAALTDPAGLGGFTVIEWHAAPEPPLRHRAEELSRQQRTDGFLTPVWQDVGNAGRSGGHGRCRRVCDRRAGHDLRHRRGSGPARQRRSR